MNSFCGDHTAREINLMELAMQTFIRTFLVIVILLAVFTTPAQAGDVLNPGDIAIIGYRFGSSAEFSFVCLRRITAGTEIVFTDNGWKDTQVFRFGEGFLPWTAPTGDCQLGQVINVKLINYTTGMNLELSGDQIIAYQGSSSSPNLIFALNSYEDGWQSNSTNSSSSSLPTVLAVLNPSPSIAIKQTGYAIYSKIDRDFASTSAALAFVTDPANWTRSTSPLAMPTGDFSFTTTAVHLSDFNAETGDETAPWWVLVGLVVIPVMLMVSKRPKKDCCQ